MRSSYWLAAAAVACRGYTSLCDPDCDGAETGGAPGHRGGASSAGGQRTAEGGATITQGGATITQGGAHAGESRNEIPAQGGASQAGAPQQSDDGGAAGTPALHAGAGGGSECHDAADCADASVCNGTERCEAGACVAGDPLSCDPGTTCDDDFPSEPCGFANPAPWLLLYNTRQLWGLPTSEIGKRPPIDLGPFDSLTSNSAGLETLYYGDGSRVLFSQGSFDLGSRMLELSLGRGIPKPLHKIPNIPNWGLYSAPYFFPESQGAVIQDMNTMSYWLDFSGELAVASPLPVTLDDPEPLQVCRGERAFLMSPDATALVYIENQERREAELGSGGKTPSPDRSLIFIAGENARIVRCDPSAESVSLGVTVINWSWSGDSRHVFVQLPDKTRKLYRVSSELVLSEVWSGTLVGDWMWTYDRSKLIFRRPGDPSPSYAYLDLSEPSVAFHDFALPGLAEELSCGGDGCSAYIQQKDPIAARQLVFQAFGSASKPILLASNLTPDSGTHSFDSARHRVVLERPTSDGRRELTWLDYNQEPIIERRLFAWGPDEELSFTVASDSSGVIVQDKRDLSWRWFPLTEADVPPVKLEVPAYVAWFQPWR